MSMTKGRLCLFVACSLFLTTASEKLRGSASIANAFPLKSGSQSADFVLKNAAEKVFKPPTSVQADVCGSQICKASEICGNIVSRKTGKFTASCLPKVTKSCEASSTCSKGHRCAQTQVVTAVRTFSRKQCIRNSLCKRKRNSCGSKTCKPGENCAYTVSSTGKRTGPLKCLSKASKTCQPGGDCSKKTVCARTKILSTGKQNYYCVPNAMCKRKKKKSEPFEKCGKKTCKPDASCAYTVSSTGKRIGSFKCLPKASRMCKVGDSCTTKTTCARTKILSTGKEDFYCVPNAMCRRKTKKSKLEKCGKKTCKPSAMCSYTVSSSGKRTGSRKCLPKVTKSCKPGDSCSKKTTCALTKIVSTGTMEHYCVPNTMCKRTPKKSTSSEGATTKPTTSPEMTETNVGESKKCGSETCDSDATTCAQTIDGNGTRGPRTCIRTAAVQCGKEDKCDPGSECTRTFVFALDQVVKLCLGKTTPKDPVGEQCGKTKCAIGTQCVQAVSANRMKTIGPARCIELKTTKQCARGDNCKVGFTCALTNIFSRSGGKLPTKDESDSLCLPNSMVETTMELEKCGATTCSEDTHCAQVVPYDGSKSKCPLKCISKAATRCRHNGEGSSCAEGTNCARTHIIATGTKTHICVPSEMDPLKELVPVQCGDEKCFFGSVCGKVGDGPLICIKKPLNDCDTRLKKGACPAKQSCTPTQLEGYPDIKYLCTPNVPLGESEEEKFVGEPEEGDFGESEEEEFGESEEEEFSDFEDEEFVGIQSGAEGKCGGPCKDGEECRLTLEPESIVYNCLPKKTTACFENVFCQAETKCGDTWKNNVWTKQCVKVEERCGMTGKPCKSNEKCVSGKCVPIEASCGIEGECDESSACRTTSVDGLLTKQCLPKDILNCGDTDYWCPRGSLCTKTSGGEHMCQRPCGGVICENGETCKLARSEDGGSTTLRYQCHRKPESCVSRCMKEGKKCARSFSLIDGRGLFETKCVAMDAVLCGNIAVCGAGLECQEVKSAIGEKYSRCVPPNKSVVKRNLSLTGECSCVKTPRCYTETCTTKPREQSTDEERLVCLSDLRPRGISAGAVFGEGMFGAMYKCRKLGKARVLTYKSAEEETLGQCLTDEVVAVEEIKTTTTDETCSETCAKSGQKCERVYSEKDGKAVFTNKCVDKTANVCGTLYAVCDVGYTCRSIFDVDTRIATDKCVKDKGDGKMIDDDQIAIQSTAEGQGTTCSCVETPKFYKQNCVEVANVLSNEKLVCLEDLKRDGVFLTDIFGSGSFGDFKTCKKTGAMRTLHYKSIDPDPTGQNGQCLFDTVNDVEPISATAVGVPETRETCLCEQDTDKEPGTCHVWSTAKKDGPCFSRPCLRSWKCSESQVPPTDGPSFVCVKVKIFDVIEPTEVEGQCVGKKKERIVVKRIEV